MADGLNQEENSVNTELTYDSGDVSEESIATKITGSDNVLIAFVGRRNQSYQQYEHGHHLPQPKRNSNQQVAWEKEENEAHWT